MAVDFIEGFDWHAVGLAWNNAACTASARGWNSSSPASVSFQAGRFTGQSAMCNGANAQRVLSQNTQKIWIGFAIKIASVSGTAAVLTFSDGATAQIDVWTDASAKTLYWRRNGVTQGTASKTYLTGNWFYLEVYLNVNDSAGEIEIRMDEAVVLTATGVNTRMTANDWTNRITLGHIAGFQQYFDDLYVLNDQTGLQGFQGDCRVETLFPNGDGDIHQFTRSTGANNYGNVDEVGPNGDTDYNYSSTVGHEDLYQIGNVSNTGPIVAVQSSSYARKDDAGTRVLKNELRIGGTSYPAAAGVTLTASYAYGMDTREVSPASGIAFTKSEVDGMQSGATVIT